MRSNAPLYLQGDFAIILANQVAKRAAKAAVEDEHLVFGFAATDTVMEESSRGGGGAHQAIAQPEAVSGMGIRSRQRMN